MAEEVVVTRTLSERMMEAGANLLDELDKSGYPVRGALWLYDPDAELWRLLIAAPDIRSRGSRKTYQKIQSVMSKMSKNKPKLEDISVVDDADSIVTLLRSAIQTRKGISRIRFARNTINGTFVEDAYIYRITESP